MWSWIRKQFSRAWNFIKKNFHKAAAVVGAGFTMITIEVLGLVAMDYILLPLAMKSLFGLIFLCFGYFLVIFSAIMIGQQLFEYLWEVCDLTKSKTKTVIAIDEMNNSATIEEDVPVDVFTLAGALAGRPKI